MNPLSKRVCISLSLGAAILGARPASAGTPKAVPHPKGTVMDSTARPFGLSPEEQAKVKIVLARPPSESGSGKEVIEIHGSGDTRRTYSVSTKTGGRTVSGKVKAAEVSALLVLMESEQVLTAEAEEEGKTAHTGQPRLSLTLPSGERTTYADSDPYFANFEHIAGAIQLLAGMGETRTGSPPPFGLKPAELEKVRIFLSNSVKKTGYGKEQLEISGTGDVTISRSVNYEAPLASLTGKVSREHALALLSYLEANGFSGMEENYSANSMYESVRHVGLTLPTGKKGVSAEDSQAPREFIRLYGAVKFLAGIAVPECIDRRKYFFFYL